MMKRKLIRSATVIGFAMIVFSVIVGLAMDSAYGVGKASEKALDAQLGSAVKQHSPWLGPALVIGAAVSIGASCLGAGYAVGKVGAAALGAISERPELVTRSLLYVALAEGIAIYGLVVAIMLIGKL